MLRAGARLGFVGTIDAEQRGAFSGYPDHVVTLVRRGHEVSVGDATVQRTDPHVLTGEQLLSTSRPTFALSSPINGVARRNLTVDERNRAERSN